MPPAKAGVDSRAALLIGFPRKRTDKTEQKRTKSSKTEQNGA